MSDLGTIDYIVPRVSTQRMLCCAHARENGATPYQHESLYRFYDNDGRLLYVGITFSIASRWAKHRRKKAWWPEVRRARVTCFLGEGIARQHEIRAILTESPIYNIARPKAVAR